MIDEKILHEEIVKWCKAEIDRGNYKIDTVDMCAMVRNIIDSQPKVGEWITCSERLPKCDGCYLVWRPHFFGGEIGMPAICYFDGQDTWHDSYGVDFTRILNEKDVVAWMPLPAPFIESED